MSKTNVNYNSQIAPGNYMLVVFKAIIIVAVILINVYILIKPFEEVAHEQIQNGVLYLHKDVNIIIDKSLNDCMLWNIVALCVLCYLTVNIQRVAQGNQMVPTIQSVGKVFFLIFKFVVGAFVTGVVSYIGGFAIGFVVCFAVMLISLDGFLFDITGFYSAVETVIAVFAIVVAVIGGTACAFLKKK